MAMQYKTSYKVYSAWNYQKEIEDLNQASKQGWQLVNGGCFHSRFVKNPDIRYRYQLDYQKVDDMGRYIETFREQGWEYVNSTFNGWHYFRKLYAPSLPEESYEIFTDRESLQEMNNRWARFALILGVIIGVLVVICAVRMILKPQLPVLIQLLTFAVESITLFRGAFIMYNPVSSRNRRGDGVLLAVFFAVILLGTVSYIVLLDQRPHLSMQQQADLISDPFDNCLGSFEVHYPDIYYFDLQIDAKSPLILEIVNDKGEVVYSETGTSINKDDIRIKLARGQYRFSMTCEAGFNIKCSIR